jgi:pimeloyl-ACP methyl ester carboxylesterase
MHECSFDVYGRRLAALAWGEPGAVPVLAVHGWLDNAASFIPLGERLKGCQLVALDLAGNGQSDHRAPDGEYNIWSDLPDLEAVADQLGWDRFSLLGHSRGAIISCLYASSRPQRIARIALLDAIVPPLAAAADCPQQFAQFLADKKRLLDRPGRVFADPADAIAIREEKGSSAEAAKLIGSRNLKAVEGGWCWSHDARLQGASAMKLTESHIRAVLAGLSMPGLLLLAEEGGLHRGTPPDLPESITVKTLPGGHHCHMDASADTVAELLQAFLVGNAGEAAS